MRISDVKFQVFTRDLPAPAEQFMVFDISLVKLVTEGVLVRILTDDGIEGNSMCIGGRGMAEYLKEDMRIDDEGYAHVPQQPGLGMEIDWDSIDKWTITTL